LSHQGLDRCMCVEIRFWWKVVEGNYILWWEEDKKWWFGRYVWSWGRIGICFPNEDTIIAWYQLLIRVSVNDVVEKGNW